MLYQVGPYWINVQTIAWVMDDPVMAELTIHFSGTTPTMHLRSVERDQMLAVLGRLTQSR